MLQALTEDGHVYSWGSGGFGQLGYECNIQYEPRLIPTAENICAIAGGEFMFPLFMYSLFFRVHFRL
jgi:alpha-tubulin suppressor-like RCC1 family protein